MSQSKDPFGAGMAAYRAGILLRECPFTCADGTAWRKGWRAAQAAERKKARAQRARGDYGAWPKR